MEGSGATRAMKSKCEHVSTILRTRPLRCAPPLSLLVRRGVVVVFHSSLSRRSIALHNCTHATGCNDATKWATRHRRCHVCAWHSARRLGCGECVRASHSSPAVRADDTGVFRGGGSTWYSVQRMVDRLSAHEMGACWTDLSALLARCAGLGEVAQRKGADRCDHAPAHCKQIRSRSMDVPSMTANE